MVDYIVELLVDGAWQNITSDVRDSSPLLMNRGRRDWASVTDPATLSLTLNNGPSNVSQGVQGRYSPRNPRSDLFGKIGRNTPVRVRRGDERDVSLALPGVEESYASAPDAAALDITGDIDVRIEVSLDDWQPEDGQFHILVAKADSTFLETSWIFYFGETGRVFFGWSTDGTSGGLVTAGTDATVDADAGRIALRVTLDVDNGASGNDATFYTSDSIDGPWTQLGSTITQAGATSIHSGDSGLGVGADFDGTDFFSDGQVLNGRVYAMEVRDGIDGTIVADPDFTAHEPQTRTFTDDAGNTWTLHEHATFTDASIRFAGEMKSWPVRWDLSGADRWVKASAAGLSRRLQKGKKALKSSLFRDLSIREAVVAYWPLEEPKGATRFQSGRADDDSILTPDPANTVTLANDDESFVASDALPTVGAGTIRGNLPIFSGADDQRFVFLVSIPADVTWSTDKLLARFFTAGSVRRWDITKTSADNTRVQAFDEDGVEVENLFTTFPLFGVPQAFSLWLQQDGADIDWQIARFDPAEGTASAIGDTITGETFGRFSRVELGSTDDMEDTAFGHAFLLNDDVQSIWDVFNDSMNGWSGETGSTRLLRLATDEGLPPVRLVGIDDDVDTMGLQRQRTLMELLREVPSTDLGILTDRADAIGLQYRTRVDLYSQEPALTLDYSSGVFDEDFLPVDDDQNIVNEVTVSRPRGSSLTAADTTGPLSSLDPPDGVGLYDEEQEVNVDEDARLTDQAFWRLHLGTVNEQRFPEVTLNLRNERAEALIDDVLSLTEGDIIRITNPPIWLPGGPYDLLVEAIREEKKAVEHKITFACSPASPWGVGVYDGDEGAQESRYSSDGTTITEDVTTTETSIDITTPTGPGWGDADLPYNILIGGEKMTVTAVTNAGGENQTITVTRSVNGIVKEHSSGAEMTLFKPAYYAL